MIKSIFNKLKQVMIFGFNYRTKIGRIIEDVVFDSVQKVVIKVQFD